MDICERIVWLDQGFGEAPARFIWLSIAKTEGVDAILIWNIEDIMPQLADIHHTTNVVFCNHPLNTLKMPFCRQYDECRMVLKPAQVYTVPTQYGHIPSQQIPGKKQFSPQLARTGVPAGGFIFQNKHR
jgi:hypothetical protein